MVDALAWPVRRVGRARLRTKLALSLSVAALLPMLVVASLASGVVLGNLESGLTGDAERQLEVGLNLTLRSVERLGDDAVRLGSDQSLAAAIPRGETVVGEVLAAAAPHLPSSLVQVLGPDGKVVASRVMGGNRMRFAELAVDDRSPVVQAGLGWAARVTIELSPTGVVVRAAAPVVDAALSLTGVVVVSVPLDGDFADSIKGALGADVLVGSLNAGTATSSVRDELGRRLAAVQVPASVLKAVRARQRPVQNLDVSGREHAVAWTALEDDRGHALGLFAVALDRRPLLRAQRVAFRSLAIGAALALVFALALAGVLARRVGQPIAKLHRGAVAIARGDLDHTLDVAEGDEIGDLSVAFAHMTGTLKENQQRLAARMREMVALHDAGRAMSSVIDLGQVSSKICDSVARTFDVRLCALFLVPPGAVGDEGRVIVAASRVRNVDGAPAIADPAALAPIAAQVARLRATLRLDDVSNDSRRRDAAAAAGVDGALMAVPLERKGSVVGVLIVGRSASARPFIEADANLLSTFADQAAAAIENARLYEQVRDASEELEAKVRLRTSELTAINRELGRALADLRETQAQLVLSERMAGLGLLVAGVAHEINSPSAAIRGAVDAITAAVGNMAEPVRALASAVDDADAREALFTVLEGYGKDLAGRRMPTGAAVRRMARELRTVLEPAVGPAATDLGQRLAEAGADEALVTDLIQRSPGARPALAYLIEQSNLHRNAYIIGNAISRIQRIVGALKTYSHLDEEPTRVPADLHEGIETTLTLFAYALRDITVVRHFGQLPSVPIFVDELNQVWTNLIQNAVQALGGKGTITIETERVKHAERDGVSVRVVDDGPGIPPEIKERIFEPFFTTKPKGEGTGLGLGIVSTIIAKHGGELSCESEPGKTRFEVWLPCEVLAGGAAS
ncbi:MAG TPA: ATP-binding protein [Kofleriaceae bacterium]|nr:ATP-binding protein [Kofleriaceae bacterium]